MVRKAPVGVVHHGRGNNGEIEGDASGQLDQPLTLRTLLPDAIDPHALGQQRQPIGRAQRAKLNAERHRTSTPSPAVASRPTSTA